MRQVKENDLRQLVSESLRESNDSYTIQELFQRFPTTTELVCGFNYQDIIEIDNEKYNYYKLDKKDWTDKR